MDSGNSGSMQSSSGGDEEYDSRAESISAFLNPTGHMGLMPNPLQQPQPPPPLHHHASTTPMFYQLSTYIDPLSRPDPPLSNPNSLLNLDMVWCKTQRSEPNCTEINPMLAPPSSAQRFFSAQGQSCALLTSSSPTIPFPPMTENPTPRASSSSATSDQSHSHAVRNPKKRSRASRRAPTTVLTTDTTNFRAMVQEFTGIPAPPFTSSPFPRSRFDLFGTPSNVRSNPLDASQPPYLLRPFAQKAQPPPFVSSSSLSSSFLNSSMADGFASTNTNNITSGSASNASNSSPSELGLSTQPHSLLNMQNPILTFQSLHQPPPKYPLSNKTNISSKTQGSLEIPSNDSHLKMGVLDEFGLSHGHVNTPLTGLPNLVSPDGTASRNNDNPVSWGDRRGSTNDGDEGHLRSVNGNYNLLLNVTNGKLNYSASSSNFHGEKGLEHVRTRDVTMTQLANAILKVSA
ncbi:hypothetical protein F0562_003247 [Nyssa sinensis]|uniref:VQ domain-containing protein n=1 Tax=Nyssa sinensis TaxID=561372 RepID=A0A5J5BUZ8_9ASTE|nr:hypothetical protein F0562_003247 [Nyssa sinensis]